MKSKLIAASHKTDRLIIFFAGWGMDWRPFTHLAPERADVLFLYDYRDLTLPADVCAYGEKYTHIDIAAWSFGVWVCARLHAQLPRPQQCVAIAGTLRPCDETFGITPRMLMLTEEKFSDITREKFVQRMCGDADTYARYCAIAPQRTLEEQKEELRYLIETMTHEPTPENIYTHALICTQDVIIPSARQKAFWQTEAHTEVTAPHFPFFQWNKWQDIFSYATNTA